MPFTHIEKASVSFQSSIPNFADLMDHSWLPLLQQTHCAQATIKFKACDGYGYVEPLELSSLVCPQH